MSLAPGSVGQNACVVGKTTSDCGISFARTLRVPDGLDTLYGDPGQQQVNDVLNKPVGQRFPRHQELLVQQADQHLVRETAVYARTQLASRSGLLKHCGCNLVASALWVLADSA
jgi:hypothetical protein